MLDMTLRSIRRRVKALALANCATP
jgi:hypothetical protein